MVVTRGTVKRETFVEVPLAFSCEHNGLGFKDAEFHSFCGAPFVNDVEYADT